MKKTNVFIMIALVLIVGVLVFNCNNDTTNGTTASPSPSPSATIAATDITSTVVTNADFETFQFHTTPVVTSNKGADFEGWTPRNNPPSADADPGIFYDVVAIEGSASVAMRNPVGGTGMTQTITGLTGSTTYIVTALTIGNVSIDEQGAENSLLTVTEYDSDEEVQDSVEVPRQADDEEPALLEVTFTTGSGDTSATVNLDRGRNSYVVVAFDDVRVFEQ